jgi:hypothetical protein
MEPLHRILIYQPKPKAGRFKIFIPYPLRTERKILKKQNTSFYHPHQKLWSIVNTREAWSKITSLFQGKYDLVHENSIPKRAGGRLQEQALLALADLEQKLVLKGYSRSTVKNYRSAIVPFLQFFQSRDYQQKRRDRGIRLSSHHQI